MRGIEDFSLVDEPFLLGLASVAFLLVALAVFRTPGTMGRRLLAAAGVLAVLATVGAGINGHFAYVRTVGQVFGDVTGNVVDADELAQPCDRLPREGSLLADEIPGTASGFDARTAWLYFPPAWCLDDDTEFPVIVLLNGVPGATRDWLNAGLADETADAFAADHDGKAPVLVMPDTGGSHETGCVDSERSGNIETYLIEDLPAHLEKTYGDRLADAPDGWAVAGLSAGGTCALTLTLRHDDVYATFGDYSGEAFGVGSAEATIRSSFEGDARAYEAHDPARLLQRRADGRGGGLDHLGGWFEVGGDDGAAVGDTERYAELAAATGMDTCLVVVPDEGSTFILWARAFAQSLPWMAARTGLVRESDAFREPCQSGG